MMYSSFLSQMFSHPFRSISGFHSKVNVCRALGFFPHKITEIKAPFPQELKTCPLANLNSPNEVSRATPVNKMYACSGATHASKG